MHESKALSGTFGTVLEGTVLGKIAKTSPWNVHSLKFILTAATWGKVEANVTSSRKPWHFSDCESPRFPVNIRRCHDQI
jgi:hypothetical protein